MKTRFGMLRKLQAFTLLELIIVMVISTIVMAICGYALTFFLKQTGDFHTDNETRMRELQLYTVLSHDIAHCQNVMNSDNNITCSDSYLQTIRYRFLDNLIIRTVNEEPDSFQLPLSRYECSYIKSNNHPIDSIFSSLTICFSSLKDSTWQFKRTNSLTEQINSSLASAN